MRPNPREPNATKSQFDQKSCDQILLYAPSAPQSDWKAVRPSGVGTVPCDSSAGPHAPNRFGLVVACNPRADGKTAPACHKDAKKRNFDHSESTAEYWEAYADRADLCFLEMWF
jgi:hypothetical protein